MPLVTRLTKMLGIKHPIIQGGMHYVGYAPLAAAVSDAGGIGLVTALTQPSAEALQEEIRKTKSLTSKPFGVNLTLLPALQPPNYQEYADVVEEEMKTGQLRLIETAGHFKGLQPFVQQFKNAGAVVIHKCVQVRHAKSAQKMGVDMVSMDGFDCAGHPGEMDVGNWVLLAKAAQEIDIPIVASGGCGTGRQLAAALVLGCEGINMGTRFMATTEAPIHDNIKKALCDADENSSTLVMRSIPNTERVFLNATAREVQRREAESPGDFSAIADLVRGDNYRKVFQETGNVDDGVWSAGPVMGLIDSVVSCEELVSTIVAEAEQALTEKSCLVVPDSEAPPTPTPHFMVTYKYVDDVLEKRAPVRAAHFEVVAEFKARGDLVSGGPLADLSGAHIVFRSAEAAAEFVARDPYVASGVVSHHSCSEWSVVV
eukprot:m.23858 g.23858  ORF g.23858 m.23858 type:complete len:428 (-) comp7315_c0_seq1:166-1449(-)